MKRKIQSFIQYWFPYYFEKPDYDTATDAAVFEKFVHYELKTDLRICNGSTYPLRQAYRKLPHSELILFKEYLQYIELSKWQIYRMRDWRLRAAMSELRKDIFNYVESKTRRKK